MPYHYTIIAAGDDATKSPTGDDATKQSLLQGESLTGNKAYVVRYRNPLATATSSFLEWVLLGYSYISDGAKLTTGSSAATIGTSRGIEGARATFYPTIKRLAELRHTTDRTIQRHLGRADRSSSSHPGNKGRPAQHPLYRGAKRRRRTETGKAGRKPLKRP